MYADDEIAGIVLALVGIGGAFIGKAYLAYRRATRARREYEAFILDLQRRINNSDRK